MGYLLGGVDGIVVVVSVRTGVGGFEPELGIGSSSLVVSALNSTSPPTHFTRAPPSHAKNRYLNSRLMILHASELATELFDEVQSPRCSTFAISIATAKLPAWFASRAWYYAIQNGV